MYVKGVLFDRAFVGGLQACHEVARVSQEHLEVDNIDMPETTTVVGVAV